MSLHAQAPDWDVLVVGRSYAGLSTALNLGRARRSVLLVGNGGPRNEAVLHTHGLITRDGATPGAIVAAAEEELGRYPTVELVDARVTGIEAVDGGFRALLGTRPTTAAAVVLATGANDNPPPIPGLAEHWGRGVFTCPYCDGFEHADTHIAVTGSPELTAHLARLLTGWSDDVSAFATESIARVNGDGTKVVSLTLADGTDVPIGALFLAQLPTPNNQLTLELGTEVDDNGFVVVDATQRTTVPGVWAVGDVASSRANMALAIAAGVNAATDLNVALLDRAAPVP